MANSDSTIEKIREIKRYMKVVHDSLHDISDLMLELELSETERLAKSGESKRLFKKINDERTPEVQNFMDYIDRLFGIDEED